ncbi:ATP-binding protein [Crenobacter sp. SG2305]|uniref:PAS domain-containing sensor histidine kinase n=1 Tax=Crenobacter oryzisoli TaxID=3056844 RepID=UPI0025AAED0D|nr:ATP-binding protein [Crenobacter sp. SG2305]MDN0082622.1 ATP-binding protein [Crenobacter sp. SG2305]
MRDSLELVPVAIVTINEQGKIVFANSKAAELFGYCSDELSGSSISLLLPELPLTKVQTRDGSFSSAEMSSPPIQQMLVAKRSDGVEFFSEVTTRQCWLDGISVRLVVVTDRSERYEMHRNRQELAHLTRISALGELAGSLAHELNQPLTAILSNAQAAQRFLESDPINLSEIRETLKDIVTDNCRASEIIRKIRALVRKGVVELQPVDVGSVVYDVALLVHSDAIVRGIRVMLDIADNLPMVRGDKVQLQQVVLNLLLNAFEAMHDCPADDRIVKVQVSSEANGTVQIVVRDRGHGLTVDKLDKIFKPFFTSKPHGLGLGLSISRTILTAHGGRIWAENNTDQGASFYITLPWEHPAGLNRSC